MGMDAEAGGRRTQEHLVRRRSAALRTARSQAPVLVTVRQSTSAV